jgi:glycosyltransferase involved in cell wall biosynthesis
MPYKNLTKFGFDVTLTNMLNDKILGDKDVAVLQRQHSPAVYQWAQWFKGARPTNKLIYEFDDNLHAVPASNPNSYIYRTGTEATNNMELFLRLADMLTVSTNGLKREYARFNDNIHVCHNAIDNPTIPIMENYQAPERKNDGVIRIGWAGSATHNSDFATIIKPLSEVLMERKNVRLVFIGADMKSIMPRSVQMKCEFFGHTFPISPDGKPLSYSQDGISPTEAYYTFLKSANLDIGLAPIERYVFNSCKSYIKLLEYGIAKIPFIASRFGPYQEYTGQQYFGPNQLGFTPEDAKGWKKALNALIDSAELRQRLVENNYKNVIEKHLMSTKIQEWLNAYENGFGITGGTEEGTYDELIDKGQKVA